MRYAPRYYASEIVIKSCLKIVAWPPHIPFTDISNIEGGSGTLAELLRLWDLPDGDPEKLRFEPASHEDQVNAARNPESVHPTPHFLPALKAKTAVATARAAARTAADARAEVYHPHNMQYVGRLSTTLTDVPRSQRRDTGQRRARASDRDPRVRKKKQMRGVRSMPYVLPGTDGTGSSSSGERAAKRRRVGEYPLADRIAQFDLSPEFRGELTKSVRIASALA